MERFESGSLRNDKLRVDFAIKNEIRANTLAQIETTSFFVAGEAKRARNKKDTVESWK